MKFTKYIFGSLIITGILSLGSCADTLNEETLQPIPEQAEDDGMVDVKINFSLLDLENIGTRDGETAGSSSLGTKIENIDLLVYALRDSLDNLLYQYGQGIVDPNGYLNDAKFLNKYNEDTDNNQTLIPVRWKKKNTNTQEQKYEIDGDGITLRVMRGTVYKLSVWAQNKDCEAYDFNNFNAIKVDYETASNNDENRDAFCSSTTFSIGQMNSTVSVTLTRPFARINVGVKSTSDHNDENYNKYKESQVVLEDVSQYFNLVKNRVWNQKEINDYVNGHQLAEVKDLFGADSPQALLNEVTFDYANLPLDDKNAPQTFDVHDYTNWSGGTLNPIVYTSVSMCYVLVPEAEYNTEGSEDKKDEATAGEGDKTDNGIIAPTLKTITIKLRSLSLKGEDGSNLEVQYPNTKNSEGVIEPLTLEVKRNWRTNLLFPDWEWTKEGINAPQTVQ